ncbi:MULTISPECIES: YegS/Rv2252/BmrU family lipid kinase [Clostridium]|uniref:Lipid kinase, YegS/Rv2252/BmrU family n=1 Tax=Clostridium botulinum (strain Eklund 17B / Type B) TaxID=935198 RepID=B2TPZ4_CLOBB|nr:MULTISPECIES: YegS/Rv2252/BmrU family lipid kinase [Clostridium]ACD24050.1 lipid kinase, YegS/Rv2252/BmrU family [Clostridium botulinum B str. Eklund 17B (NRP)]MBN1039667.1 YegS/Rv2252/BmrU family lipid kinase [Clostridium botulinum]MBN1046509.1 YegS/Rv2252/BmrU family lipid kinase [Clostridium botulinum]MBN1056409.1 YegS/Rv2252/BmrU family lipid kinase [Clostridium botulinum]MBY6975454.1 YegS/Rv2252/BmrU family lipid kinase [Clostridium botulinum]
MKKVKFIYNPYSGENIIVNEIDNVIKLHEEAELQIIPYRIQRGKSLEEALEDIDNTYKYILIAGGDGTVDSVVNAMKKRKIDLPIGILPVGTANDFGKFINIPNNIIDACNKILKSKPVGVDLGKINDKYFINVASTGLFTDVSQKTDVNLKNTIGKLAYYLKGIEELPNFRRLKVNIKSKECNYDGEMYLLLVFNGESAGNFRLATEADVTDGKLDVIVFKAIPIIELIPLFIKILKGEHLDSNKVVYFKTDDLYIECNEEIVTDIDGERGPDFPLNIKCIKGGIKVLGID